MHRSSSHTNQRPAAVIRSRFFSFLLRARMRLTGFYSKGSRLGARGQAAVDYVLFKGTVDARDMIGTC